MFGRRRSRTERMSQDARHAAKQGLERAKHRAAALSEQLPEPGEVIADLREQAEPVLKAAREQAEKKLPIGQAVPKKKSRSKKPFVLVTLLIVGAVVAYLLLSKRDQEPAYLMEEPDEPDYSPATPSPEGMNHNGSGPSDSPAPSQPSAPVNHEDVPERASALMAAEPAAPTQAASSAIGAGTPSNSTSASTTPSASPSFGYQPRAQVAAWDLPPSSVPPMQGRASL